MLDFYFNFEYLRAVFFLNQAFLSAHFVLPILLDNFLSFVFYEAVVSEKGVT